MKRRWGYCSACAVTWCEVGTRDLHCPDCKSNADARELLGALAQLLEERFADCTLCSGRLSTVVDLVP